MPIGAEQTANGYEVAWKVTGADQYTVWYTDNSGNYLSSAFDFASGTSAALQSFETSFQQDLNGDGVIGLADRCRRRISFIKASMPTACNCIL